MAFINCTQTGKYLCYYTSRAEIVQLEFVNRPDVSTPTQGSSSGDDLQIMCALCICASQIGVDWEWTVIALIFADALHMHNEQDCPCFEMRHFFDERLTFLQRDLRKELVKEFACNPVWLSG